MVLSKLNNQISYPELKKIHHDDNKMESELYNIFIHDLPVVIAIGKVKRDFESENILYFPIYLINKNNKAIQIGVYEIDANYHLEYLNDKVTLDLERNVGLMPILYKFATKSMIDKERLIIESDDTEEELDEDGVDGADGADGEDDIEEGADHEKTNKEPEIYTNLEKEKESSDTKQKHISSNVITIPENRKDFFVLTKGIEIPPLLKEETKTTANDIIQKYHNKTSDNWIVKYMKNNYYDIVENEGGCDSFFSCVRDAFSQIAQQTSIQKLRKKFADCISEEVFLFYKDNYDRFYNTLNDTIKTAKDLNIEYDKIRQQYNNILDRNEKKLLTEKGKSVKAQHDKLIYEKKYVSLFMKEFKFMKTVDNVEKFKKHLMSCEFWGNKWAIQWAIVLMEYCLNVKFIFFSKEYFKENDYSNIIQLGMGNHYFQLKDALEKKRKFEPDYYIMLMMDQPKQQSGVDYKLVSYRKKHIFTFSELPYYVKKNIITKYNEKNAGLFSVIPEFHKFVKTIKNKGKGEGKNDGKGREKTVTGTGVDNDMSELEELSETSLRGLYDDSIMFISYIHSNGKPFPGLGIGEKIRMDVLLEFVDLALIDNWRKKLSNEWIQPFTLDNHSWNSVEHYYQASKFKQNNPGFYLSFSLDTGSELSKNVEMAKSAGGKTGKWEVDGKDVVLLRAENVEIDPDFYKSRYNKELYDAQYAKFTQNKELKDLLMATKNAKLMHFVNNKPLEEYKNLMEIREKLKGMDGIV
uniref:NADAR domain-containing protein n=1 Tax=viral metagenome TaxID=1070528 RepID=A0A6C0EE49_9ZZZZ